MANTNNPINHILQVVNGNPQQFLQNQINGNPNIATMQTQLNNMMKSSGMSGKDFAMQYAKQNGIPQDQLMALAKAFGVK